MLVRFFLMLRAAGVPVSLTEFLALLEALKARVGTLSVEDFYVLGRTVLVKDERHYDRYDRVFSQHFKGLEQAFATLGEGSVPEEWLRRMAELNLSPEERAKVEALGGFDKLMEALKELLREQQGRHEGGSKWIGTAGRSPFGAYGYNPEGVRIGQDGSRNRSAVKVWDRREFRNLDDSVELGTRNIKLALRRLRRFAREGAAEELDLGGTIDATARNAGWLDLRLVPERHNAIKVLLFLDVGGSMDDHVRICEELFTAARAEFKHLEYYYFHNFVYETVWKDNRRRHAERIPTHEVIRTYGSDYRLVFVGDATMGPYEIVQPGGSIEHWNDESGATWLGRLQRAYPKHVWLNPEPEDRWDYVPSIGVARQLLEGRMYPLTLAGIDRATRALNAR
jgi:uncharacterized protein with von Willebrand factor type A (vWA) domain